ncbi:AI-2E family transporter [Marinobacteraceae bacterium S3BR75-40.1]
MHQKLEQRSFLFMLVLVTILFLFLLKPFFGPIFWACAIAVIFAPLQRRILNLYGDRHNAAALTTLSVCVVIVVIPVFFVLISFLDQGMALYQQIQAGKIDPAAYLDQIKSAFPTLQHFLERLGVNMDRLKDQAGSAAMASSRFVAQNALSLGQNTFRFFINMALMLYLAFFLIREGGTLVNLMIRALPLGDERERHLFAKFAEVTRATVKGNLVVAVVQGSLGGLIFWFLDISAPVLWGVVMAVMSLIPAVGAGLIWAPVAIYLFAVGEVVDAIILAVFGVGVIGLVDNILRPILVGRDTKLPDYVILLSTLGGLALFGLHGFVVGPLVAALFTAFWGIFIREFNAPEEEPVLEEAHEIAPHKKHGKH